MIKNIPNALTLLNLFCGALAVVSILNLHIEEALVLHGICLLADFLDGLIARKLKVDGPLGVQLDSLADVVSFGVFPSAIVYVFLAQSWDIDPAMSTLSDRMYLYPAFLLAVFGGLRLARFNISTEQSDKFIGIPIPAMAMFFAGLLLIQQDGNIALIEIIEKKWFLYGSVIIFSFLMNSKFDHFKIKPTKEFLTQPFIILLLGSIVGLVIFYPVISLSAGILLYSCLSIISNFVKI